MNVKTNQQHITFGLFLVWAGIQSSGSSCKSINTVKFKGYIFLSFRNATSSNLPAKAKPIWFFIIGFRILI